MSSKHLIRGARRVFVQSRYEYAPAYRPASEGPCHNDIQIFLHIPKSAGTTLRQIIQLGAEHEQRRYHRFNVARVPAVHIDTNWLGALPTIEKTSPTARNCLDYITGHFPYGVHRLFRRPARYVTVIRNPLDRERSTFNHLYQRGFIDKVNVEEVIKRRLVADNPQVRMIAGLVGHNAQCDHRHLAQAKHNLERHFLLYGVSDKLRDFITALCTLNGWPGFAYPRVNISRIKLIEEFSPSLKDRLLAYHALDLALYEYANERFRSRFEAMMHQFHEADENDVVIVVGVGDVHGKGTVVSKDQLASMDLDGLSEELEKSTTSDQLSQ